MGTGRQGPRPHGWRRRGQRAVQHKLTLGQRCATELTAVKGEQYCPPVPAARAWLLCHLDASLPLGKAQWPLSLQAGLLRPGRLFFHCSDFHTSPEGREASSVSMAADEAQNGTWVCRVKQ